MLKIKKKILFFVLTLILLVLSYFFVCQKLYGKVILLPIGVSSISDEMTEEQIEQKKNTELEWLFWNQDSYIEYNFTNSKKYIDIQVGAALYKVSTAKMIFGVDGNYQDEYYNNLKSQSHNVIEIPKSTYNCVKIYPVGNYFEHNDGVIGEYNNTKKEITQYFVISKIYTTNVYPDIIRLLGTTLIIWGILCLFIFMCLFRRESKVFDSQWKYKRISAFFLVFCMFLLVKEMCYPYNGISYFGDAGSYYSNADTFIKDNIFSLKNYLYTDPEKTMRFRGMLLPLLILLMKIPGMIFKSNIHISYDIFSCAFFAIFFSVGLPSFWKILFKKRVNLFQIIAPGLLFVLFLRGLITNPLSDLYGAIFSFYAILFIIKMQKAINQITQIFWGILGGIALYFAYNIRPSNMLMIMGCILIVLVQNRKNIIKGIKLLVIVICGMLLCSIPQIIVNANICNITSPVVLTGEYEFKGRSLIVHQLCSGLAINRFECELVAGNDATSRKYFNPMGNVLYTLCDNNVTSIVDFMVFCCQHLFSVVVIWSIHFILVLDMRFPEIINTQLIHLSWGMLISTIAFWYIFILEISSRLKRNNVYVVWKKGGKKYFEEKLLCFLWIIILILPSMAQIVGAFETRFATVIYLVCFTYFSYEINFVDIKNKIIKKPLECLIILFIFTVFLGIVWSAAYSCPSVGMPLTME